MSADFQILKGPHPDEPAIMAAVAASTLKPANFPTPGDLYRTFPLGTRARATDWGDWIFGRWEPVKRETPRTGGEDEIGFFFYKAIPSTALQVESIEVDVWGRVNQWRYLDYTSAVLPVRGDVYEAPGDVWAWEDGETMLWEDGEEIGIETTEYVYDAREEPTDDAVTMVTVQTLPFNSISRTDQLFDEATGRTYDRTRTWTLSASNPGTAAALDTDTGLYTTVEGIGFNLWLAITQPASSLPQRREDAVPWDDLASTYWPAVLEGYDFHYVVSESVLYWERLLSYRMREPFTQPVRVTKRRWFQYTPPTVEVPTPMIPSSIRVSGKLMSFALPECLHAEFEYSEANLVAALNDTLLGAAARMVVWNFSATNQTDWPETITQTNFDYQRGGYLCEETIFYRPADYNSGELTVSRRDILPGDGITHFYSPQTVSGDDFVI